MNEHATASQLGAADAVAAGIRQEPAVLDLKMLRNEVLRRRWLIVLATALGAVAGLLLPAFLSSGATATTTLLLVHDEAEEPSRAMETWVGLLGSRTFAERVIADLDLDASARDLLESISAEARTTRLLALTAAADEPDEAVALAESAATGFLGLRAELLGRESSAQVAEVEAQIDELSERASALSSDIEALQGTSDAASTTSLNELIASRAQLTSQIDDLRSRLGVEEVRLASLVEGSRVVDPAEVDPGRGVVGTALGAASGAVGGLALGLALVIGQSLLSDRPRRRSEIADALGAPILLSVPRVRGRRQAARRAREMLAFGLADKLSGTHSRWAVLGVAGDTEASMVAATLMRTLAGRGVRTTGIDLTQSGRLASHVGVSALPLEQWSERLAVGQEAAAEECTVVRPSHVPTLAHRPHRVDDPESLLSGPHPRHRRSAGSTVVVAEVLPAIGADHLRTWADVALLVVPAGRATHELLNSVGSVTRAAGFVDVVAVLVGTDRHDHSVDDQALRRSQPVADTAPSERPGGADAAGSGAS